MRKLIWGVFREDSILGRITSRIWILFGANILFVLFSLPVVTAGPAFAAMYHVCLRALRKDPDLNPFAEFWRGFCTNFRQAFLAWMGALAVGTVLILDLMFVLRTSEAVKIFRYPLYVVSGIFLMVLFHLFPVMAAFQDSLKGLIRNSFYFAAKNPVRSAGILFLNTAPLIWTYYDVTRLPLYAFFWSVTGFAAIAMICSKLLLRDFSAYLPEPDTGEEEET